MFVFWKSIDATRRESAGVTPPSAPAQSSLARRARVEDESRRTFRPPSSFFLSPTRTCLPLPIHSPSTRTVPHPDLCQPFKSPAIPLVNQTLSYSNSTSRGMAGLLRWDAAAVGGGAAGGSSHLPSAIFGSARSPITRKSASPRSPPARSAAGTRRGAVVVCSHHT